MYIYSWNLYTYVPTRLNMTPCQRSPARLQFQQKTLTFELMKKIAGSKPQKHSVANESLTCSPCHLRHPHILLLSLLATNLLVSIRLIDKRQVLLHNNYDPVQLLVHIRKSICSFLKPKKINRAQNQSYLLCSG